MENLVLDNAGYVQLACFGIAKYIEDRSVKKHITNEYFFYRTFTLCGTPEYLTPEMILSFKDHSFGVD